jgi:hypothetical protein
MWRRLHPMPLIAKGLVFLLGSTLLLLALWC